MILRKLPAYISLFVLLILSGCKSGGRNGQETLPADLVNNPNSATGTAGKESLPVIRFEEEEHDFGRIIPRT